jgi:hypothetical protein
MSTIIDLPEKLGKVTPDVRQMFEAQLSVGELIVPEKLVPKVIKWYGNKDDSHPKNAIDRASSQKVIRTSNRCTFEAAQFNELRAKRPVQRPDTEALESFIENAKHNCDFCDPVAMTTADTWGRISGDYSVTAANAAKYDANHGIVIFKPHHPHRFDHLHVRDYLRVANKWLQTMHKIDKSLKYPFIMWNCLGSAGASQVHGHLQMLINPHGFYGHQASMVSAAANYKRDYWNDWIETHRQVGLEHEYNGIYLAATMTPVKEKEVVIIDPRPQRQADDCTFADAITLVLRSFIDTLGVLSFNVGIYLPPYDDDGKYNLPLIARCVDRGDPSPLPAGKSKTADIGGMELYGSSIIASDPYKVIEAIRMQKETEQKELFSITR